MAAKKNRHYPVNRTIRLREETPGLVAGLRVARGAQLLTFANRRLYRQSYTYSMKVDVDVDSTAATAGVEVYVLRDTWDLHGAYRWAMKNYYNTMKEELAVGGAATRWHDFRVSPGALAGENTVPVARDVNLVAGAADMGTFIPLSGGDYDISSVVDADGNTKQFSLDPASTATVYSIMQEWQKKDRVDAEPAASDTSLSYDGINSENDGENYTILRSNGAAPPYSTSSDSGAFVKVGELKTNTNGSQKLSTGYFDAPLGIVILVSTGFTVSDPAIVRNLPITVSFQSGNYKGVKATPYATPQLVDGKEYEVV